MGSDEFSCASCSSDRTVRVWDLRMNRGTNKGKGKDAATATSTKRKTGKEKDGSLFVFRSHHQPVWCLGSPEEKGNGLALKKIYSGGRAGVLYEHDLWNGSSRPLLSEENSICSLQIAPGRGGKRTVWCGTTSSTIHCWELGGAEGKRGGEEGEGGQGGEGRGEAGRAEGEGEGGEKITPGEGQETGEEARWKVLPPLRTLEPPRIPVGTMLARPVERIKGLPGIVKYHVLNDKQHILVMNNGRKVRSEERGHKHKNMEILALITLGPFT